jgi:hypothetical protein
MTWRISDIMDAIAKEPRAGQEPYYAGLVRDDLRRYNTAANVALGSHYHNITYALGYPTTTIFAEAHKIDVRTDGWQTYDNKLADLLVEEARLRKIPEEP